MSLTRRQFKRFFTAILCLGMVLAPHLGLFDFSINQAQAASPSDTIATATTTSATGTSTMRSIVQTSDGTIHSFVQLNAGTVTCSGSSKSGLVWMMSSDSGSTWACQDQLSTATNLYVSADIDASDNVYVIYSTNSVSGSTSSDLFYRKLTKGSGASWTLESAQTVLDSTASTRAYSYGVVALQGTTRMWVAANYNDGTNRQITVYYSDGLTAAPTWTQSTAMLDSTSSSDSHIPAIARFGSKIGIFYYMTSDGQGSTLRWKYRSDSDGLTTWGTNEMIFMANVSPSSEYSVVGTSTGEVYVAAISTNLYVGYYNGTAWYPSAVLDSSVNSASGVSVTTDGTAAYVFYGSKSGLSTTLATYAPLQYYHVYPPAGVNDAITAVKGVSNQGIFGKVWLYGSATDSYTDDTTDAGDSDSADMLHTTTGRILSAQNDAAYFGRTEKFDAVSWDISTNGSGGTAAWEYCSAVDGSSVCTIWSSLTLTDSSAPNFTADGRAIFTAPSDWVASKVSTDSSALYYVRARASVAYTAGPIGVQTVSTPITFGVRTPKTVQSNTIPLVWAENSSTVARVRSNTTSVTVITTTPGSAEELSPAVVTFANNYPVQTNTRSNLKNTVKASNGTIHTFQNVGPQGRASTCGKPGLVWLSSSDNGVTWSCQAQLHLTTNSDNIEFYPSAVIDGSDNIYVVYSAIGTSGNFFHDLFYRKLSYSGGSWSAGAEQTIAVSGASDGGYHFGDIILEGTTRVWVAARKVTTNSAYTIPVWYSDGLTATPTWTSSNSSLTGANGSFSYNAPLFVRFGTNIGVIYNDSATSGQIKWKTRADSDGLTTWSAAATVTTNTTTYGSFAAITDSSNNVYVAVISSTSVYFTYYNGSSWSTAATVSSASASTASEAGNFVSLATDNTDVWVFYRETSLGSNFGRLAYKKGVSPFATGNFDTNPSNVLPAQTALDKVWVYSSSAGTYEDETTDATDTGTIDVLHTGTSKLVSAVNDAVYFGKTSTFDAVSWSLATGTGGILAWEYYNGSAWAPLTSFIGNGQPDHSFGTNALSQVTFAPPTNWQTVAVNGEGTAHYYIRARARQAYTTAPSSGSQFAATSLPSMAYVLPSASSALSVMYSDGYRSNSSSYATNHRIRYIASVANSAPSAPSALGATAYVNSSSGTDTTPDLTFTLSDGNGSDTLKYQIQIDDSSSFASPVVDYTSALAAQGSRTFTVGQAAGSGSYTTGSEGQTLSDGSYYWRAKATDNGNLSSSYSTANSGSIAFKIDATAPGTASSLTSSSHSASTWSSDTTVTITWSAATDATSGLSGYSYSFDTTSNTTPDTTSDLGAVTTVTSSALADGNGHYFHLRAVDSAGNWGSAVHLGPFYVDTTAPSVPGTPSTTTPTEDTTPAWMWTASSDSAAGLASTPYTVQWSQSSNFSSGVSSGASSAATFTHATALAAGTWYFRVKSSDTLSNSSSHSANGSVVITEPEAAATPTPTPTPTASATTDPTPTPTATPTTSSSPTPTPTATTTAKKTSSQETTTDTTLEEVLTTAFGSGVTTPRPVFMGKWNLLPGPVVGGFVLSPLPSGFQKLAEQFSSLDLTFERLNIATLSGLTKLQTVPFNLPGLTKTIGLPEPKQLTDMTVGEKAKIPNDFVFAQTGNQLIDFETKLTVTSDGQPRQVISSITNHQLFLVTKPSTSVNKVSGQLIFTSPTVSLRSPAVTLSTLFAPPALAEEAKTVENRLVTQAFTYEDPDRDGIYTAAITTPATDGQYEIITRYHASSETIGDKEVRLITVIDPEGYIYEKQGGKEVRIPNATVTIHHFFGDTKTVWPANDFSQVNPQVTNQTGKYAFLVPNGTYKLTVKAQGYKNYESQPFVVDDERGIHTNIELISSNPFKRVNWLFVSIVMAVLLAFQYVYKLQLYKKRRHR